MLRAERQPAGHLFRVARHAGIWRVIHNGAFYRDYATEADATAAAHEAARTEQASGHEARVVTSEGEAPAVAD